MIFGNSVCNFLLRSIPFAGYQCPNSDWRSADDAQIKEWQNADYRQYFQCGFRQSTSLGLRGLNWVFANPGMIRSELMSQQAARNIPIVRSKAKPKKQFTASEETLRSYILNLDREKV